MPPPEACAGTHKKLKPPAWATDSLKPNLGRPFLKSEFTREKGTQKPQPTTKQTMKLTEEQVSQLISDKKAYFQEHGLLSPENISQDVEAWCDANDIEKSLFGGDWCDEILWEQLDDLLEYMSNEQVSRYTMEIRLEIYKAIAREVRKYNPLLAAAFDATK